MRRHRGRTLIVGLLAGSLLVASAGSVAVAIPEGSGITARVDVGSNTEDPDHAADGYSGLDGLADLFAEDGGKAAETAAKEVAKESESFLTMLGHGLFDAFIDFGVDQGLDALMDAIWPKPSSADMFNSIMSSLASEQESINELSAQLDALSAQVGTTSTLAAEAACTAATTAADTRVDRIKLAFDNFQPVYDANWLYENLSGSQGAAGLNVIGGQVFGASGATTPTFLSGLNQVAIATQDLATSLTSSAGASDGGVIAKCADAAAAGLAARIKALPAGTPDVIGERETVYFRRMQTLTAYYTSWVNVGAAMSAFGGYMATALTSSNPPKTAQEAKLLCANAKPGASWNALTCNGTYSIIGSTRQSVAAAWQQTGAGWSQATGGVLGTAIGVPAANATGPITTFTDTQTVWVQDIAQYGKPLSPQYQIADLSSSASTVSVARPTTGVASSASSEATISKEAPISIGVSAQYDVWASDRFNYQGGNGGGWMQPWRNASLSLKNPTWQKATFAPASTAQWDGLLNLTQAPLSSDPRITTAQAGQSNYCLPFNSLSDQAFNCTSPRIGSLMGQAGLLNGGQAPSNLIIYTGETRQFLPQESPLWWTSDTYIGGPPKFPAGWQFPPQTVASFLDSESLMVNGFSAVMNPPTGDGRGITTPSSIAPFITSSIGNPQATLTMSSDVGKGKSAVACGKDGNGGIPQTNSPYSIGQFFNGNYSLSGCGGVTWVSPGNGKTAIAHTPNASFYAPLIANVRYQGDDWNFCAWPATQDCPANPFWSKTGSYPGWLLDGGFFPTTGANADTSAVWPTPQTQYMWPVLDTKRSCTGGMTSFTQGASGSINPPQMCRELFEDYISTEYGVQFGGIGVHVDAGMKTGAGSAPVAGIVLSNTSGVDKTGTLLLEASSALTFASNALTSQVVANPTAKSGNALTGCTQIAGVGNWKCTVTVPASGIALQIPATVQRGKPVSLQVTFTDGPTDTATDRRSVYPGQASALAAPPAALAGVKFTAGAGRPTLSWTTPLSALAGGISGYQITAKRTTTSGSTAAKTWSVPIDQVTTSGTGSSGGGVGALSSVSLPASITPAAGTWTLTIAATNAAGSGPATTLTVKYSTGVPDPVTGFTAVPQANGGVRLDWDPVDAAPSVVWYKVSATSPSGASIPPVVVSSAGHVTEAGLDTGDWTFTIVASNAVGDSAPVTASARVQGAIPAEPADVNATINMFGQIACPGALRRATSCRRPRTTSRSTRRAAQPPWQVPMCRSRRCSRSSVCRSPCSSGGSRRPVAMSWRCRRRTTSARGRPASRRSSSLRCSSTP